MENLKEILLQNKEATTCLALMRSRYVAFTQAKVDYLMLTHHSSTRPTKDRKAIKKWAKSVQWMGLVIVGTQAGQAQDEEGYVEFKALYIEDGEMQQIHENSLFKKENQKWVYVSGQHFQ